MAVEIRKIEEKDFNILPELFNNRKNTDLIKWVYSHPCADGKSAYVAIEDGKLVGAIGFVRSQYNINGEVKNGIIPLSWEVEEEKRGFVGTKLLFTALKGADFYIGMDGSEDMKMIFEKLNFKKVGEGTSARKIIEPLQHLKTLKKVGPKDLIRMSRSIMKNAFKKKKTKESFLREIKEYDSEKVNNDRSVFHHVISNEHIDWLKKNPGMEQYLFEININNKIYAPVIVFVKEIKNGVKRGQIVHLPPMEKEDLEMLPEIIYELENKLKQKGATAITTLVTNSDVKMAFKKVGYTFDAKARPIVFKGPKDVFEILQKTKIQLSFAESDKSVRNI